MKKIALFGISLLVATGCASQKLVQQNEHDYHPPKIYVPKDNLGKRVVFKDGEATLIGFLEGDKTKIRSTFLSPDHPMNIYSNSDSIKANYERLAQVE